MKDGQSQDQSPVVPTSYWNIRKSQNSQELKPDPVKWNQEPQLGCVAPYAVHGESQMSQNGIQNSADNFPLRELSKVSTLSLQLYRASQQVYAKHRTNLKSYSSGVFFRATWGCFYPLKIHNSRPSPEVGTYTLFFKVLKRVPSFTMQVLDQNNGCLCHS